MNCCCSEVVDRHFGERHAEEKLLEYRRRGISGISRILVDGLLARTDPNQTLLDVGGGFGTISHELLAAGAQHATIVEIASSYVDAGRKEARRLGLDGRITYLQGDFVHLAARVRPADVVTLDRVVCCYPDFEGLIAASVDKARTWYALSYPRNLWYVRAGNAWRNLLRRRRGNPFRTYVHPHTAIHALVVEAGFERHIHRETMYWQASIYRRTQP